MAKIVLNNEKEKVLAQVEKMLKTVHIVTKPRISQLLRYTVEKTVDGEIDALTAKSMYKEIFEPQKRTLYKVDEEGVVRTNMKALRVEVTDYYQTEGIDDEVLIRFQPGKYVPEITFREVSDSPVTNEGQEDAAIGNGPLAGNAASAAVLGDTPRERYAAAVASVTDEFLLNIRKHAKYIWYRQEGSPNDISEGYPPLGTWPQGRHSIFLSVRVDTAPLPSHVASAAAKFGHPSPTHEQWKSVLANFDVPWHLLVVNGLAAATSINIPNTVARASVVGFTIALFLDALGTHLSGKGGRERGIAKLRSESERNIEAVMAAAIQQIQERRSNIVNGLLGLNS